LVAKKKAIFLNLQVLYEGLGISDPASNNSVDMPKGTLQKVDAIYLKVKSTLNEEKTLFFEKEIRPAYQSLKIGIAAYNKLIIKRPYSFVAKVMNHKPMA
jgi:hypothetical protein